MIFFAIKETKAFYPLDNLIMNMYGPGNEIIIYYSIIL